jgi:hypothetical protein
VVEFGITGGNDPSLDKKGEGDHNIILFFYE